MSKTKDLDYLKKITQNLLSLLKIEAQIDFLEEEDLVHVNLKTENPGLLIGYHGETLSALQLVISLILYKETGHWREILLNIGNYREIRKEQIYQLLQKVVSRVIETQTPQPLPYLSSEERKIAHTLLSNHPQVYSESQGQGYFRRLYIKPKNIKV